jgi:hypothetical protein
MRPEILARRAAYGDTQAKILAVLKAEGDALTAQMVTDRTGVAAARRVLAALERRGCVAHYLDTDVLDRRGRAEVKWYRWVADLPPQNKRTEYFRAYYAKRKSRQQDER